MSSIVLGLGVTAGNSKDQVPAFTVFLLLGKADNRKINKMILGSDKSYKENKTG